MKKFSLFLIFLLVFVYLMPLVNAQVQTITILTIDDYNSPTNEGGQIMPTATFMVVNGSAPYLNAVDYPYNYARKYQYDTESNLNASFTNWNRYSDSWNITLNVRHYLADELYSAIYFRWYEPSSSHIQFIQVENFTGGGWQWSNNTITNLIQNKTALNKAEIGYYCGEYSGQEFYAMIDYAEIKITYTDYSGLIFRSILFLFSAIVIILAPIISHKLCKTTFGKIFMLTCIWVMFGFLFYTTIFVLIG